LLLIPAFMNAYRSVGWYFPTPEVPGSAGMITPAFKRMAPVAGELNPTYPVQYVQYFKTGLDYYTQGKYRQAIANLDSAAAVSPRPVYVYVLYYKAFCLFLSQQHDLAKPLLEQVVGIDSTLYEPHKELYMYARLEGDAASAELHRRWLLKLVPWFFPRIQALADQQVAEQRRGFPAGK